MLMALGQHVTPWATVRPETGPNRVRAVWPGQRGLAVRRPYDHCRMSSRLVRQPRSSSIVEVRFAHAPAVRRRLIRVEKHDHHIGAIWCAGDGPAAHCRIARCQIKARRRPAAVRPCGRFSRGGQRGGREQHMSHSPCSRLPHRQERK